MLLSEATLDLIDPDVERPVYRRSEVSPGIAHIGVGAFHRAHQASILHDFLTSSPYDPEAKSWGILGVGLLPTDERLYRDLAQQDFLYSLTNLSPDGQKRIRIIGSLVDYSYGPRNPASTVSRLSDPAIKVISLSITEGGYNRLAQSKKFDFDNPDILHDLTSNAPPKTVFGYLAEICKNRAQYTGQGLTMLSCDNVQSNGQTLREMLLSFVSVWDPGLLSWIEDNVSFPNTMVDGITPAVTESARVQASAALKVQDKCPVVAETYFQWVIEDNFVSGRPCIENHGCLMVKDVVPYELMKLRLLNLSHQALAYFGFLLGYKYVHEAARDQMLKQFVLNYMILEAEPTLLPVIEIDLKTYKLGLLDRFSNPHIVDTIARLAEFTSDRIPQWLVPVIQHQLKTGGSIRFSAAIIASWARYAEGVGEDGATHAIIDSRADEIIERAQKSLTHPVAFIENSDLFGSLAQDERFTQLYAQTLVKLRREGARKTLQELLP